MIKIRELDIKKNKVEILKLDNWNIGESLSWVDCFNPTDDELKHLSQKTSIALEDLKTSFDPNKRPHVIPYDNYSLIIFRAPYKENGVYTTAPVGIFIFKNDVITIHSKPVEAIADFRELPDKQNLMIFKKGAPYFVYRFIDAAVGDFFKVMDEISDSVEAIENKVLHNVSKVVPKEIFEQKRVLIYTHKALVANRDVISSLEKQYLQEFTPEVLRILRNLYNDITQLIELATTYREILSNILDMYLSSVNNNLSKVVKTLTIISTFVLIPMFIASIYGMNFHTENVFNMPELSWKYGYPFALLLMLLSMTISYLWFKKKEWL